MSNEDNNGGKLKLTERILSEARSEADSIFAEAGEEVARIEQKADKEIETIRKSAQQKADTEREGILERSRMSAELESRKYELKVRRGVVDEAFSAAFDELCSMSGDKRDSLLVKNALAEADGGETLIPASGDKESFSRLLPEINARLTESGRASLKLGDATDSIRGGFILKAAGYEKNCSFESMLSDIRESQEATVAQILFG